MLIYINKEKAISIHIYVHKHTYGTGQFTMSYFLL